MLENYTMAALDFSRCIEKDDTNFTAYFYRGYSHEMLENAEMALENYMKACERGSPEGCNEYHRLSAETGEAERSPGSNE